MLQTWHKDWLHQLQGQQHMPSHPLLMEMPPPRINPACLSYERTCHSHPVFHQAGLWLARWGRFSCLRPPLPLTLQHLGPRDVARKEGGRGGLHRGPWGAWRGMMAWPLSSPQARFSQPSRWLAREKKQEWPKFSVCFIYTEDAYCVCERHTQGSRGQEGG